MGVMKGQNRGCSVEMGSASSLASQLPQGSRSTRNLCGSWLASDAGDAVYLKDRIVPLTINR
jgi:hypothetical protein